ncbi:hypothetical protein M514_26759 [Trichuris suis]|uniref:Uncharacterized protein n=1 Tax=Trichuris suis TaxID=68888 RepID=A0A085MV11_9BILA|nr:hypothetical protein M514_26759 [Trichuris suis]
MSRLLLFKRRFAIGELCQFQNLIEVKKEGQASDADVEVYREHLQALHDDFVRRFEHILSIVIPEWVINPFTNVEDEEISLQIELLDLQVECRTKAQAGRGLQKKIPVLYQSYCVGRGEKTAHLSSVTGCSWSNAVTCACRLPPSCRTLIS